MSGFLLILAAIWVWRWAVRREQAERREAFLIEISRDRTVARWNLFAAVAPYIEAEHV